MNALPEGFRGDSTVNVYREIKGATNFGPGHGADMVPYTVGHGGIGTHIGGKDSASRLADQSGIEEVLFSIEGLSPAGVEAVRKAIESIQDPSSVTHMAVMEALRAGN